MFEIDGINYEVLINRKKIKNLYIRFQNNKIVVSANNFVSKNYIYNLLEQEKDYIKKMIEKEKKQDSKGIFYLGNELEFVKSDNILITESNAYGPDIESINEYIENNSLVFFQNRVNRLLNQFDNLPKFKLKSRKMKSRWGVCNKKSMTITLNKELIHKDVSLIDYVIIHELCHFKYMDHSKYFWNEVSKYYPYYKMARKMLRS